MKAYTKKIILRRKRVPPVIVVFFSVFMGFLLLFHGQAQACTSCGCVIPAHVVTAEVVVEQHVLTRQHITDEFNIWEQFILDVIWEEHFLPAWVMMTEHLSVVAMQQMMAVGVLLDAKQQLEAERLFQQLTAEAHKDYQPTLGLCTFGTNVRSLATAERRSENAAFLMGQRSIDRQTGNMNSSASEGVYIDLRNRFEQFQRRYCDVNDNNSGLGRICPAGSAPSISINKDIDYARTVDRSLTLNIDFTDATFTGEGELTDDEEDLFALADNLYGHRVLTRIPESLLAIEKHQDDILDVRSVIAKRSIAENSFFTIAAMKAQGTPTPHPNGDDFGNSFDTGQYMKVILEGLAIPPDRIELFLGESAIGQPPDDVPENIRPSYYAQMEILTKKIFQQPEFYTDLYDTPVNVDRKGVALQAIALMQDFDTLQSYLRTEMMLSVLLELEIINLQKDVQNRINRLRTSGRKRL